MHARAGSALARGNRPRSRRIRARAARRSSRRQLFGFMFRRTSFPQAAPQRPRRTVAMAHADLEDRQSVEKLLGGLTLGQFLTSRDPQEPLCLDPSSTISEALSRLHARGILSCPVLTSKVGFGLGMHWHAIPHGPCTSSPPPPTLSFTARTNARTHAHTGPRALHTWVSTA